MNANGLGRAVSLLIVIPVVLTAQLTRYPDRVVLKPWVAPLYWQPAQSNAGEHSVVIPAATSSLPATANALVFVAMTPCRVVDTRASQGFPGAFGPPSLAGKASRTFPIQSSQTCTIPTAAQAYSFNITVVPPGPLGFITAYPTGQPLPLAATVNSPQGFIVGNAGILAAGTNGSVDIYASDVTDIVVDINGYYASISGGPGNTALGAGALANNTAGASNTANGFQALASNTIGNDNTASGTSALQNNTTGNNNTASGVNALLNNTTGVNNTATGVAALLDNTTGNQNTAIGVAALELNTTGGQNTASGEVALSNNTTGASNTAIGFSALQLNTTGDNNIAIGNGAAGSVSGGNSNNIHIGSGGAASDSSTIRIGTPGTQTSFFAVGVRGVTTSNSDAIAVVIDSNGQLGTVSSSRRFKEDIEDMGAASVDLMRLRPVTYRYKQPFADGSKPLQYGLIAEEVADVYPDLVAHSANGQIETVKYQVLDSMLLNELQKQAEKNRQHAEKIKSLEGRLAELEELLSKVPPPASQKAP